MCEQNPDAKGPHATWPRGDGARMRAGVTVSACSAFSPTPPTARSLASKIGCTGFQPQPDATHYFHSRGTCYLNSSTYLTIITFTSNHIRDQYLGIAREAGGAEVLVTGNLWMVSTDQAGASAVQKAIGGDVH
jgi:hypothetical protein